MVTITAVEIPLTLRTGGHSRVLALSTRSRNH